MTPSMVAKGFIPPSQFSTLTKRSHTVIVGPRGSGKTTLLKMLTPEALAESSRLKKLSPGLGVEFTGVFVPTDITWTRQLQAFGRIGLSDAQADSLSDASFTTAVLRAFCQALHHRFNTVGSSGYLKVARLNSDPAREAAIAIAIAESWGLPLRVPSFLGLKTSLGDRLVSLGRFASRENRLSADGRDERFADNADLDLELMSGLVVAIDTVESFAPETVNERWCLLFDELELAPSSIRQSLLAAMRSVDERLLFKLSISPYSDDLDLLKTAVSAMPGHDHDEISLSYGRKDDGVDFSLALMQSVVASRSDKEIDLTKLLGPSDFSFAETEGALSTNPTTERYGSSSREEDYLTQLARDDATFESYVRKHAGSVKGLLKLSGQERAQALRKIMPLVIVRATFRLPDSSSAVDYRRYKTRRNPDLYRGVLALATTLEGNPRWIIGVLNSLLDSQSGNSIPGDKQAAEIARTVNRFRALLSTIPINSIPKRGRRGLLPLIDQIGEYFKERVIADDFNPDPVASFVVDAIASNELVGAIGNALNAGALVYVPDSEGEAILTSLRGKRFRLSYLLATQFGLPLRLERAVSLRTLLSKDSAHLELDLFSEVDRKQSDASSTR